MTAILKYGSDTDLPLDIPPEALVANCAAPTGLDDDSVPPAAKAVQAPLDFPRLEQVVVPGDHVVLALSPGVPQAADVIAALVPALVEGGVSSEDVTVLRTPADVEAGQPDPRSHLPPPLRQSVQLFTHNPAEQTQMSYLAVDDQAEPIYLNRRVCEADLVIPIGCLRPNESGVGNGSSGVWNETIYPTFADRKAVEHLAHNGVPQSKGQLAHRRRQIDHVAWLLGVQVTAQVVPGAGDRSLRVLVGSPEAVFRDGRALCQRIWHWEVPQRASLVVAGVGGGAPQQTWENVGRALEAALQVTTDGGAIVLCTELEAKPGAALKQLAVATDTETAQHRLRKQHSADAPLARLLAESLDRVAVYLLSRLDEDVVTPLGFAHVAEPSEIARLASHHDSCILLADAQYARPTVAGE